MPSENSANLILSCSRDCLSVSYVIMLCDILASKMDMVDISCHDRFLGSLYLGMKTTVKAEIVSFLQSSTLWHKTFHIMASALALRTANSPPTGISGLEVNRVNSAAADSRRTE
ncbi:Uncharacterized protein HZ326_6791 [Fusarium oxysporum f. sp. albedinis]|nr:Uncharacterized protein HZ326_6791 [Fusarium oxysporum f. sp. albedinis]